MICRVPLDDYSHVAGHRFPGGTTSVPHWMNRLWGDAVEADSDPPASACGTTPCR
jgi:hypothetical protein